jgi:heme/copper-type cytochrome/quinol oxidase subunit 3
MTTHELALHDDFRAARQLGIQHVKLGMWIFLGTEVMFFGGLLAAFLTYKFNNPTTETALLDVTLVGINTFVLLTSSFTVVNALESARQGKTGRLSIYLLLTIVLGLIFLAGQGYEFATLYSEGVTLTSSVFGSSFFTLTGFHGAHVLIGVLWAIRNLILSLRGRFGPQSDLGIELFGLYWHFVDIVWIVLFTVIYLIGVV